MPAIMYNHNSWRKFSWSLEQEGLFQLFSRRWRYCANQDISVRQREKTLNNFCRLHCQGVKWLTLHSAHSYCNSMRNIYDPKYLPAYKFNFKLKTKEEIHKFYLKWRFASQKVIEIVFGISCVSRKVIFS